MAEKIDTRVIAESPGPKVDVATNAVLQAVVTRMMNLRNLRNQFDVDQINHHFRIARKTDSFII
jgi:hypothetical protein